MTRPSTASLELLFRPRSIAVIGASGTPTKIGGVPIAHLLRYGFRGADLSDQPAIREIQELRAYKNVKDRGPGDRSCDRRGAGGVGVQGAHTRRPKRR